MRHKILIKFICIFIVSTITCIFCFQSTYKSYDVPGIVVSKNTEQYAYGKHHRNMSTRYIMCVKPNDTNKFKHYALYVDYATYFTHNVGDKITFSVSENKCLKGFKRSIWIEEISSMIVILSGILIIISFSGILTVIVEPYLNKILF